MAENNQAPGWGPNDKHRLLNTRLPRVDAPFKTTGFANYTYDIRVPGMLFARILRAPIAHGTVASLDDSAALKVPGVRAIVHGATDIHYEGTPVAAVAADTAEAADDGIHAIIVKYEKTPFVVNFDDAIKPDAPQALPNDKNVAPGNSRGNAEQVATALGKSDAVVEAEYRTAILHHACLETHGVVVDYRGGDSATVYCSTQGTFSIPGDAAANLGLARANVTGIVQYMGGGFGSKGGPGQEGSMACSLSKKTGVPVKLMLTRYDEFVTAGNGPGSVYKVKAGVMKDGTLAAVDSRQFTLAGIGKARVTDLPYVYRAGMVYQEASSVFTNEDASRALRAPGHPQACFAMESLMDELAEKIGMDPVAFRKKNINGNATWLRQLDVGAKEIGWERRKASGQWPGTLKRGFGCGLGDWGGGGRAQCVVNLVILRDGSVTASCGSQDLGTGTRTYIRAIVAEELGLGMHDVVEKIGDSRLGNANFSGGSTTAASLSPAVKVAAYNARVKMSALVAPLLGATEDQVTFADGNVAGNGKTFTWKQACAALPEAGLAVRGEFQENLQHGGVHGACFAEVEVDTETGHVQTIKMTHVQDVGLPLNRLAVESQINGGMIQGIGMALYEGRVTDAKLGCMINPSFNDYKLAGALEMPELVPLIDDGDTRQTVAGVGEPPSVPSAAAIANAVANACGVRVRELPITPDKILMGLQTKKA